jgi:hypothetical protein
VSDRNYVSTTIRLAKTLFASFALAVVTVIVFVGLAIALGWQQPLAAFATSPWMGVLVVIATLVWSWILRNRLS